MSEGGLSLWQMRILGIDYGDRRFGLALSDPSAMIASPLEVVEGEERLLGRLRELIPEEGIELLVVGLPRNMDGTLGPKAREVMRFCDRLAGAVGVPVEVWDERLTTFQAERYLRDSGLSAGKRRSRVDKVAAQILLQSYLDGRKHRAPQGDPPAGAGGR